MIESRPQQPNTERRLPQSVVRCVLLLIAAFLVCIGVEAICRYTLHMTDLRYIWPLRVEDVHFPDLVRFYPRFAYLHTTAFFTSKEFIPFMYPASMAIVYKGFYAFAPHIVRAYFIFWIGIFLVAATLYWRALSRRNVRPDSIALLLWPGLLLSYPVWFVLNQANMEIVVWVLIAGGTSLFLYEKSYGAAICFGLAASLKIYPGLFLVLLLFRRQNRQVAIGGLSAAVFSIGATEFVGPTFTVAWQGIQNNLNTFREAYMLQVRDETTLDHSLFGLIKVIVMRHRLIDPHTVSTGLNLYLGVMTVLVLGLLIWKVWRLPVINQVMFCTIVCVLLPPTSYEYTLLHVLTVLCLLILLAVDSGRVRCHIRGLSAAMLCCAATLAFLPELNFRLRGFEGQVKCLLLIALLILTLRNRFELIQELGPSAVGTNDHVPVGVI